MVPVVADTDAWYYEWYMRWGIRLDATVDKFSLARSVYQRAEICTGGEFTAGVEQVPEDTEVEGLQKLLEQAAQREAALKDELARLAQPTADCEEQAANLSVQQPLSQAGRAQAGKIRGKYKKVNDHAPNAWFVCGCGKSYKRTNDGSASKPEEDHKKKCTKYQTHPTL